MFIPNARHNKITYQLSSHFVVADLIGRATAAVPTRTSRIQASLPLVERGGGRSEGDPKNEVVVTETEPFCDAPDALRGSYQ